MGCEDEKQRASDMWDAVIFTEREVEFNERELGTEIADALIDAWSEDDPDLSSMWKLRTQVEKIRLAEDRHDEAKARAHRNWKDATAASKEWCECEDAEGLSDDEIEEFYGDAPHIEFEDDIMDVSKEPREDWMDAHPH